MQNEQPYSGKQVEETVKDQPMRIQDQGID